MGYGLFKNRNGGERVVSVFLSSTELTGLWVQSWQGYEYRTVWDIAPGLRHFAFYEWNESMEDCHGLIGMYIGFIYFVLTIFFYFKGMALDVISLGCFDNTG